MMVNTMPLPRQYGESLLLMSHGEGSYLYDETGKKYLDMGSGIAVNALGYGRRDLAEIASEQMKQIIHVSNLFATKPQLALAEKMCALRIPGSSRTVFEAVHFGNSGTEANEAAMKYARLYALSRRGEGCHRFISFTNGFHGRTMGALSVTANENYRLPFAPLIPDCSILPFNDVEAICRAVDEQVAGIIVEPVQGEGGLECVTTEFAHVLNKLCEEHDILLIADEVQSGIGRCGTFLASEIVGLEPDIVTLAKPLAGGLPLSATLIPRRVNVLLKPGHHASTFGGGPVTSAVALKVWDTIKHPDFLAEVRRKGDLMGKLLGHGLKNIPGEIRGAGLLRGIRFFGAAYDGRWCIEVIRRMRERGIIILKTGGDVLRFAPPLVITDEEIERAIQTLFDVIHEFKTEGEK